MGMRKRITIAISGLAFTGAAALTLGAVPASAQTVTAAPHQAVSAQPPDCDWDWRYCDRWDGWNHRYWHDGDRGHWGRWDHWHHWDNW
jgi:hypothetical protein